MYFPQLLVTCTKKRRISLLELRHGVVIDAVHVALPAIDQHIAEGVHRSVTLGVKLELFQHLRGPGRLTLHAKHG